MGQKIQAVKGMNDLLPVEQKDFKLTAAFWQAFENRIGQWAHRFGYRQIRTPIVEQTGLFVRSIGEDTDVVGKEMYTFADSNDTLSLSLRPEGTASCLRAVVEHNLLYNGGQKLWYMGPMSAANARRKGATANSTKWAWKRWALKAPISMPKSSPCAPICGASSASAHT